MGHKMKSITFQFLFVFVFHKFRLSNQHLSVNEFEATVLLFALPRLLNAALQFSDTSEKRKTPDIFQCLKSSFDTDYVRCIQSSCLIVQCAPYF